MAKSKLSKSPVFLSFGPIVLGITLTVFYDLIKSYPVFSSISLATKYILVYLSNAFRAIGTLFSYSIPIWLILSLLIFYILLLRLINWFRSIGSEPDFVSYKQDVLKSWKWSWEWQYSGHNKAWTVQRLKAHCPRCDTPMLNSQLSPDYFSCPRCNYSPDERNIEYASRIKHVILDNVKRKLHSVGNPQE